MSFQYDSDDLGYEYGYDLVCHSRVDGNLPNSKNSFINETDSPKVVYKCEVSKAPPPQPPKNEGFFETLGRAFYNGLVPDVDAKPSPTVQTPPAKSEGGKEAEKDKKDEKKGKEKTKMASPPPIPDPSGKTNPPKRAETKEATVEESTKATPAAVEAVKAEAVKAEALKSAIKVASRWPTLSKDIDTAEKTLNGEVKKALDGATKNIWSSDKKGGNLIMISNDPYQTTLTWNSGGNGFTLDSKGPSEKVATQEAPEKQAKRRTAEKAAIEVLGSIRTASGMKIGKEQIEKALKAKDSKFSIEGDPHPKEGEGDITVQVKHPDATFKVKISADGGAKIIRPKTQQANGGSSTSKEEKKVEPDYSPDKVDGGRFLQLKDLKVNDKIFDRWWNIRVKPELEKGKEAKVVLDQVRAEFANYQQMHSGKSGEDFLRGRLTIHYVGEMREALRKQGGGIHEVRDALQVHSFKLVNDPLSLKIEGRKQPNGTVASLTDQDVSELEALSKEVQSKDVAEFREDTARREAIQNYLDQLPPALREPTKEVLTRMNYLDKDGNPTQTYKAEDFRKEMFQSVEANKGPDLEKFQGFARLVQDYQIGSKKNEENRLAEHRKHPERKKEIDSKFAQKAEQLWLDLDRNIEKKFQSLDPATRQSIYLNLKAAGYYGNDGKPNVQWNENKFIGAMSDPEISEVRVAKLANLSELRAFEKEVQELQKDLQKNPDNMSEVLNQFEQNVNERIVRLEKSDPLTAAHLKHGRANIYLDITHGILTGKMVSKDPSGYHFNFSEEEARALEYGWGFRDHPNSKTASTQVDSNIFREKGLTLIGVNAGGIPPTAARIRTDAIETFRNRLASVVGQTGIDGKTAARGMFGKDYLGEEDQRPLGTLAKMANDLDRIKTAKEKGDKVALAQIGEEYKKAAEGVTIPAGGVAANQATIIENKITDSQATATAGSKEGDAKTEEKKEKEAKSATANAPAEKGEKGKKLTEKEKDKKDAQAERKQRMKIDERRVAAEEKRADAEEKRVANEADRAKKEDLRNAERAEFERKKLMQEKETAERRMAFDARQGELNRRSQENAAIMQFLSAAIGAYLSFAGQLIAAQISANVNLLASVHTTSSAPRGGGRPMG